MGKEVNEFDALPLLTHLLPGSNQLVCGLESDHGFRRNQQAGRRTTEPGEKDRRRYSI